MAADLRFGRHRLGNRRKPDDIATNTATFCRRTAPSASSRTANQNGDGRSSERVIQPFAVAYYTGATLICAWCELRNDVRHFRTDRVVSADVLEESFSIPETVIAKWLAERQDD